MLGIITTMNTLENTINLTEETWFFTGMKMPVSYKLSLAKIKPVLFLQENAPIFTCEMSAFCYDKQLLIFLRIMQFLGGLFLSRIKRLFYLPLEL
jgi:hypothetical protein